MKSSAILVPSKFKVQTEKELLELPLPAQLVDGLIVENGIVILVAKYGVGKSFVALDLALSIASGQATFLGRTLRKSGPVLYLLAEGVGRFKLRLLAWKNLHRVKRALPFYSLNNPVDLLKPDEVGLFIEAIKPTQPVLIVIDTLSRCLVGADENNQAAMTTALESCERIRRMGNGKDGGPTLLILHHAGASGKRERGSTVIPGGADTLLFLNVATRPVGNGRKKKYVPMKNILKLVTTKQKDLEGTDEAIVLRKRILEASGEFEEDGRPATSCVWVADGTDLEPDTLVQAVQHNPGLTKNELVKLVGGNKAEQRKRIDTLVSSDILRIIHDGQ
jgi:AAA domain